MKNRVKTVKKRYCHLAGKCARHILPYLVPLLLLDCFTSTGKYSLMYKEAIDA